MRRNLSILLLTLVISVACGALDKSSEQPKITAKEFQIEFLNQIATLVDRMAQEQLNHLLRDLSASIKDETYAPEFQRATDSNKLAQKIVIVKQLLDAAAVQHAGSMEHFVTVRNVNFLRVVKQQLQDMQEASAKDMRQMRIYELCKQFYEVKTATASASAKIDEPFQPRGMRTKMVAIQTAAEPRSTENGTIHIDMLDFGRRLYENVRLEGAKIIDDYLSALRHLLQEVVEEKPEQHANALSLSKLLGEIDAILETEDFYAKRQRLYAYLQSNLAEDFERFQNTQYANEDIAQILTKLRQKGLDLFLGFLFGNFEFIERLFEEWRKLLPSSAVDARPYDEDSLIFDALPQLYTVFKHETESDTKYDAYMQQVKVLKVRSANLTEAVHIYELLHNASQNLGTVTLNMIRAKCDEI